MDDTLTRRMEFVLALRRAGVGDARVLAALERVDRAAFAPPLYQALALEDSALPLGPGLVMTKPTLVARVAAALGVEAHHRVLEIGAGSGWQTAVLGALGREALGLERVEALALAAAKRLGAHPRADVIHADGAAGLAEEAPFDRIVVNAAVDDIPAELIGQLAPGGRLIAPLLRGEAQRLILIDEHGEQDLGACAFARLIGGLA